VPSIQLHAELGGTLVSEGQLNVVGIILVGDTDVPHVSLIEGTSAGNASGKRQQDNL
jgi:hypothetical protein